MSPTRIVLALAAILMIGYAAWRLWERKEPPSLPAPSATPVPQPAAPKGPQFPVQPPEAPLPRLSESDPAMLEALGALIGSPLVQKLFRAEDLARRIVATVDNLPREEYSQRLSPVHPVTGAFVTRGRIGERTIAPENARRYEEHLRTLEKVDPVRAADTYRRLYPLFQQAYVELGYPDGYFNDRLAEVIAHLLEAPEPATPYRVEAPKAMFEYVEPDDEERSSGHKVLMRMGPAQAKRAKAWLAAFRAEITRAPAAR